MTPTKSDSSKSEDFLEDTAVKFTAFGFDSETPQNFNCTSTSKTRNDYRSDLKRQEKLILANKRKSETYSTIYVSQNDHLQEKSSPDQTLSLSSTEKRVKFSNTPTTNSPQLNSTQDKIGLTQKLKNVILYLYGHLIFSFMILFYIFSIFYRQLVKMILFCFYGKRLRLIERPTDALWGYETDSSSSNIVLIFKCEGIPDMERMIDDFERKVMGFRTLLRADGNADGIYDMYAPYEKLGWIIKQKFLFYCWEKDDEFSVRNHFFMEKVMDEGNNVDERIEAICGAYLEYKLDPMKPQWEFRIVAPIPGGTSTEWGLVFCVHHGYGDGLSWLQMLRHCLADEHVPLPLEPLTTPKSFLKDNANRKTFVSKFCRFIHNSFKVPHTFACEMVKMVQEENVFHGPLVKGQKSCSWTNKEIPLKTVKAIKQRNGKPALFTSVILSCATKAFQKSFHNCNSRIPYEILSGVPYADIPYKNLVPVNNFSMTLFGLPTRILHDRQLRLMTMEKVVRNSMSSHQADMNQILTSIGGSLITPLFKLSSNMAAKSTMGLSNLPGPQEKFRLFGGQCVTKVLLFPPMKFRTAVNLGLFSYCGNVNISLAVDGTITEKYPKFPELFIKYLEQELEEFTQDSQEFSKGQLSVQYINNTIIDMNKQEDEEDLNNNTSQNFNKITTGTIII